jgi:hypothetical protein
VTFRSHDIEWARARQEEAGPDSPPGLMDSAGATWAGEPDACSDECSGAEADCPSHESSVSLAAVVLLPALCHPQRHTEAHTE